jgi:hypothetical protein
MDNADNADMRNPKLRRFPQRVGKPNAALPPDFDARVTQARSVFAATVVAGFGDPGHAQATMEQYSYCATTLGAGLVVSIWAVTF